jgi:hypothetical protein
MAPGGLAPAAPKFWPESTGNRYRKKREVKTKRLLLAQITKKYGSSNDIGPF